jgi:phosphoketolase
VSFLNAFKDAKGDWNLAEIGAAAALAGGIGMWMWKAAHQSGVPDLSSLGIGVGALIGALAAAQRLRGDTDLDRRDRDASVSR